MATPVLENGPYIFNVNNAGSENNYTTRAKKIIFEIKEALRNLGGENAIWQVIGSSDSSDYVPIGDPDPDLWITYDDVITSSPGNPHSWVVLENQTTGAQICLDYYTGSAEYCGIQFSPNGTFTGGTLSARPTSTDAPWALYPYNSFMTADTVHDNFVVNVMTSANHRTLRIFIIQRHNTTSGEYGAKAVLIEELADTPSQWISPIKYAVQDIYPDHIQNSTTPKLMTPRVDFMQDLAWKCFIETSEPYSGWLTASLIAEGYKLLNQETGSMLYWYDSSQEFAGGYPANVIGLFRPTIDKGGPIGRIQDLFLAPQAHTMLDTYQSGYTRDWIKIGSLLVPWNQTAPSLATSETARDVGVCGSFIGTPGSPYTVVRTVPALYRDLD
jgi:hypothetical protein